MRRHALWGLLFLVPNIREQQRPAQWAQFPQQQWNQRQNAWQSQAQPPAPSPVQPRPFPVGLPATTPPPREPVLINTVIQVFANDNAPEELFSETRTLTAVTGNERIEISRNTTLDTHQGELLSRPPFPARHRNPGNFKELNRELESAIPLILDELDKAEETQTAASEPTTISPSAESEIPEAETTEEENIHWVTSAQTRPAFKTEIVDLEPVQTTTAAAENQQQDLTAGTAIVDQTPFADVTAQSEAETTAGSHGRRSLDNRTNDCPTDDCRTNDRRSNNDATTTTTEATTTEERTTKITTAQATTKPPTTTEEEEYSSSATEVSSSPVMILTQQSETGTPSTTASRSPGITGELIVPDHAVHADSSEAHPRTWKPKRPTTTALRRVTPTVIPTTAESAAPPTTTTTAAAETSVELSVTTTKCPVPNDPSATLRGDVLFLLDGSTVLGPEKFERAKKLIVDTISLIQFAGEPFLEFSFRAHDCITELLEDIASTQYATGASNVGRAVEKVMRFAFTPTRGDRSDAENVLVLITDGQNDEQLQVPVELARKNATTLLVVANAEVRPNEVASLAANSDLDVFNLTDATARPLAVRLAERIQDVLSGKSMLHPVSEDGSVVHTTIQPAAQGDQQQTTVQMNVDPSSSTDDAVAPSGPREDAPVSLPSSYQDKDVQIQCLTDGVRATFQVPESFAGVLAAKDHVNVSGCFVNIPQVDAASTTIREISLVVRANQCGLKAINSESPRGTNHSVVINLFHDSQLVTAEDRSYVVQCFVPRFDLEEKTLETRLDVEGFMAFSKTIELNAVPPGCNYTLRRDTPNGPVLQTASIGQVIYHRWECSGSDEINAAYGLHVHDCWASNGSAHNYQIVDSHGCSTDASLLSEVIYANDRILAHVRSFVFSSACVFGDGDGCEGYSPPVCKSSNFSEMLLTRRVRRHESAFDAALTLDVETQRLGLTDAMRAEKHIHFARSTKECISEAFQYYDKVGDNKITVSQLDTYTGQWTDRTTRITIEDFKPIYGALKKEDRPAGFDQIVCCLSNFERDAEGYIYESDLRHLLENLGKFESFLAHLIVAFLLAGERLSPAESEGVLKHVEFSNGKARISDIADLLMGKNES
ncbi:Cuticlin-1 [Aphelenchoides fujianensis]|nr:Cuticlin-1 [Aphelenchoides fujianensis]